MLDGQTGPGRTGLVEAPPDPIGTTSVRSDDAGRPPATATAGTTDPAGRATRLWRRVRADLYPTRVPPPPSRRAVRWGVLAFLAAILVSLGRTRGPGALNTIWIEDADEFLNDALNLPFGDTVFQPFMGYYHTGPRLFAELATVFPVAWFAPVLALCAAVMYASFAAVAYAASGAYFRQWWLRLLVAAPALAFPVGHTQVDGDIATIQFASLYGLFWLCLWRPAGRGGVAAYILLALYITSSTFLSVILIPVVLLRLLAVPRTRDRLLTLALIPGYALQLHTIGSQVATRTGRYPPRFEPDWGIYHLLTKAIPRSVFGEDAVGGPMVDAIGAAVPLLIPDRPAHYAMIVGTWLLLAAAVAIAALGYTRPNWTLAVLAFGSGCVLFTVPLMTMGQLQPRYAVPTALLVYLTVAALLRPSAPGDPVEPADAGPRRRVFGWTLPPAVASTRPALFAFVFVLFICAANYRLESGRSVSPPWTNVAAIAEKACTTDPNRPNYQYKFRWWRVVIPCDRLR